VEGNGGGIREVIIKLQRRRTHWLIAAGCLVALLAGVAQTPSLFGRVTDFKVPEYYPAPKQRQLKSLLRGAVAEPNARGEVKITTLRVESYREDGTVESIVEAPECVYNYKTREASSAGPIQARTGDGRMQIDGEGFLLVLTNKSLTISNNVRTVIHDLGAKSLKP
jgi:hypothetical protein